jgi:hypothetical protein
MRSALFGKGCNAGVRGIIETVLQYSLESLEEQ